MYFNADEYQDEEMTIEGETIKFRSFRNLVYVDKPVKSEFQSLNIFIPHEFIIGKELNGYTKSDAPIFMPNTVGGYMPGSLDEPGYRKFGPKTVNSIFRAIQHGYVVVAPALRGRTLINSTGAFCGKAPACIVDYKAAVRYVKNLGIKIPGDKRKIITNGTSAGGALSALMGATGNHTDYEVYLKEIGALDGDDSVFASSCYCPIINLEHSDMAYEWEFDEIYDFHRMKMITDGEKPYFKSIDGMLTAEEIACSKEEKKSFINYVNSLNLKKVDGTSLVLDEFGNGSFKSALEEVILKSAQKAVVEKTDLASKKWLKTKDNIVLSMDFKGWAEDITRMKCPPAFDDTSLQSPENSLFGTESEDIMHFTEYSYKNSKSGGKVANKAVIKSMNPMNYINDKGAKKACFWRIRHGECDRDTSLAISMIFSNKLKELGQEVDFFSPWDTPHSGDYDLDELFIWIDGICLRNKE